MSSGIETSLDALACKKKSEIPRLRSETEDGDAVGGLKEILLPVACSVSKLQS